MARPQARPDPAALAAAGLDDAALTATAGCPAAAKLDADGPGAPPLAGLVLLARTLAGPGVSIRAAAAAVLGDQAARTTARGWIAHLEDRGLAESVPGGAGFRLTGDGKDTLAALDQAAADAKELAAQAEADRVRAEAEAERLAQAQAAERAEQEQLAVLQRAELAAAERDRLAEQARVRQAAEDAAWDAAQAAEAAREQQAEQRRQEHARTQAREARQRARRAWRRRTWQAVSAERRRPGRRGRVTRLALAATVAILTAAMVTLPGPHRTAAQPWGQAGLLGAAVYAALSLVALAGRTLGGAARLGWRRIRPQRPAPEPARRWEPGPNAAWQRAEPDPVAVAGQRAPRWPK